MMCHHMVWTRACQVSTLTTQVDPCKTLLKLFCCLLNVLGQFINIDINYSNILIHYNYISGMKLCVDLTIHTWTTLFLNYGAKSFQIKASHMTMSYFKRIAITGKWYHSNNQIYDILSKMRYERKIPFHSMQKCPNF